MTESAKQDTPKASAKPAETESAATRGEGRRETTAEPQTTTEPQTPTGAKPGEPGEAAQPDLDETKRKFREALERKHQAHNEGQGKGGREDGKISNAHGPAASRRNFRRKSG